MSQTESTVLTARQELKRELIEFAKMVAWFLILFWLLRTYVIEGYEVQGPSMEPTLINQERILVFKLPTKLSNLSLFRWLSPIDEGDIIVFESPDDENKRYVKRVRASGPKRTGGKAVEADQHDVAGEPVGTPFKIDKDGHIYVNHRRVGTVYSALDGPEGPVQEVDTVLEPGKYYVLGDHRSVSKDSRSFGAVDEDAIIGRAVVRFWPLNKISLVK